MTVKISRVRHVLITAIVFIIGIICMAIMWGNQVDDLNEQLGDQVRRVSALRDIEPGTQISEDMVQIIETPNPLGGVNGYAYRKYEAENLSEKLKPTEEEEKLRKERGPDNKWVVGKIATEHIYKGEWVNVNRLKLPTEIDDSNTRLYNIPLDSKATGAYNISVGEEVDICVLYNGDSSNKYQTLPANKLIDVVLAKRKIEDIRDESGNSAMNNAAVVPGYVCFRLTYEEINKIELAKRQGNLFVGKVGSYYEGDTTETFMADKDLPTILPKVAE